MQRFSNFMSRKERSNKDNLRVLSKVLERAGFQVKDHLNHHGSPYIYIEKPIDHDPLIETLTFGGIRIYSLGDTVCFRPQNRENAEPFGLGYLLPIKDMFKDLIKETNSEKIGLDLVRYLVEEVLNFFVISAKTQNQEDKNLDNDSLGKIVSSSDVNDYSNTVTGSTRS